MTSSIKRSVFSLFLCFALLMGIIPFASAATKDISVLLDGKKVSFGVSPQVVNGSTMVPYRALAEAVGAKVEWDGKSKATITKSGTKVELTIGQKTATVNGKSVSLDVAPFTQDGSTLVPLRFVGESLGLWVNWNQATSTASLETSKTIKHAMGSTKLEKKPERVVVLYNGMVDISVLLGVKPVGAVESFVEQPFYKYLRDEMEGVKVLGDENQPNLEAIVSLKPDLIIGSKMRHEKIYDQLKAIAPTLMSEDTYNWQENLNMAATALNKESVANKFLVDWDKQVANFKSKMGNRAKETEISIIRFNPDGSARAYLTGFAYNILKDLGFSFPEAQTKTEKEIVTIKTKEQIPVFDADYIFDFTTDWDGDGGVYKHQKEWAENPLWKNMKAAKNDNYYKVNVVTWNMSGGPMAAKKMLDDLYLFFDLE
jgi:iron complex transport system substrate-binding protein